MVDFTFHSVDTAPEGSQAILEGATKKLGFTPNLFAAQAESPLALEAYTTLSALIGEKSSFSPTEQQVVFFTGNTYHGCTFCVAAHTAISKGQKVDDAVIEALRNEQPLADAKLEALRQFAYKVIDQRGWVGDADTQAFLDAGYTKAHVLEVVTLVGLKVLSNYTNHFAHTPLNDAFKPFEWSDPRKQAAE
ncbi:MAG: carboxymuconolactone decarboxylase family protein [Pseudomonadota bacterium]